MLKTVISLILVCAAMSFSQTRDQSQPTDVNQQRSRNAKDEITVRGCVSKLSTHFILVQSDQGHSYQLQEGKRLKLESYLGQEVEVTGLESPSMSTSSETVGRTGSASPVTITVYSIKSIAKRCVAK